MNSKINMQNLINKTIIYFLSKPRSFKTLVAITIDFMFCILSVWFAYYLRLGSFVPITERGFEALVVSVFLFLFPVSHEIYGIKSFVVNVIVSHRWLTNDLVSINFLT